MIPQVELRPDSGVPLYRQLYDQIRELIAAGRIADGARLPATREWAASLGLNRATVAAAYELLERDGLVRGHVGRGSFVKAPRAAAISFATSRPSADLFPLDEFRAAAADVIGAAGLTSILQLGSPFGYEPLRTHLLQDFRKRGLAREGDDLLITNGCQQALDLLQRTLVMPGDLVFVEDPVYPGLREVLHRAGARLVGLPVGAHGVSLAELERELRRERPKMLVLTPNFQNPTGATMPAAARKDVLRLAGAFSVRVVENDLYSALRYRGAPEASLKELDRSGGVIQVGSFSKIAFPGLRVGWMLGPRAAVADCAAAKQWSDLHSDQLSQAVLLRFAECGALERHRRRVVEAGGRRLAAALEACEASLPSGSEWTRPDGGMNVWVRLPGNVDSAELLRRSVEQGVEFLPGTYFAVTHPQPNGLRLSFAGLPPDSIRSGIGILGKLASAEARRAEGNRARPAVAMV